MPTTWALRPLVRNWWDAPGSLLGAPVATAHHVGISQAAGNASQAAGNISQAAANICQAGGSISQAAGNIGEADVLTAPV